MAFPTTTVLDDFNRANENLTANANWGQGNLGFGDPTMTISSNMAIPGTSTSLWYRDYWQATTFGPDTEVYATIGQIPPTGRFTELEGRIQTPAVSTADAYELEIGWQAAGIVADLFVYRYDNDTATTLRSTAGGLGVLSAGDAVGLEITGTGVSVIIRVYKFTSGSWSQVGTDIADSSASRIVSAGNIGLSHQGGPNPAGAWDDFAGGTVVPPTGGVSTFTPFPKFILRS